MSFEPIEVLRNIRIESVRPYYVTSSLLIHIQSTEEAIALLLFYKIDTHSPTDHMHLPPVLI
jgi:hypothetical protein